MFGRGAIHPQPLLPLAQTEKSNSLSFKNNSLRRIKGKHVHHITQRMRFGLSPKALSHILLHCVPQNIAYAGTFCKIASLFCKMCRLRLVLLVASRLRKTRLIRNPSSPNPADLSSRDCRISRHIVRNSKNIFLLINNFDRRL